MLLFSGVIGWWNHVRYSSVVSNKSRNNLRSFIKTRKSQGPSRVPWGTLAGTLNQVKKTSLTWTLRFRPLKKSTNQFTAVGLTPIRSNLATKMWSTRSKAFLKSNKAVLRDDPAPSVARNQWWNIEISAKVVDEPGIKPNWHGSMEDSTTGIRAWSSTKLSATLHNVDVNKIGLRTLLKSQMVGALGKRARGWGETSASFHGRGTLHSEKDPEVLSMSAIRAAKISANSFSA